MMLELAMDTQKVEIRDILNPGHAGLTALLQCHVYVPQHFQVWIS